MAEPVTQPTPSTNPHRPWWRRGRWQALVLLAVVVFGGGWYVYEEHLEDRLVVKRFGVVEAGHIYRSGQISPYLIDDVLEDRQIGLVVDLNGRIPGDPEQEAELAAAEALGVRHIRAPMSGNGKGSPAAFKKALTQMYLARQRGEPVLVHCHAGTHRTGATVAYWRVLVEGVSVEEARQEMFRYNFPGDDPNGLWPHMDKHMRDIAEHLVEIGAIDDVPDPLPRFAR